MRGIRLAFFAAAIASTPASLPAQEASTVFSARADAVELTIYTDDIALITETRTVTLPAGPVTLVIEDVADTLLPQSVLLRDLERPLAESNFDVNQLTPETLVQHSIGQQVTLTSTNPATGIVSQVEATVAAAGDRIVLETADGVQALDCAGLPEGIEFHAIPDDLLTEPRLSARFASGEPGARTFRVSYLAHGFSWDADYIADLADNARSMRLNGWATVTNSSSRSFVQTDLNLVAGRLNLLAADDGGSRVPIQDPRFADPGDAAGQHASVLGDCFATEVPAPGRDSRDSRSELETIIVTGTRIRREQFSDYQLYRLPWKTDLQSHQTKQMQFLAHDEVSIERLYRVTIFGTDYPSLDAVYLVDDRQAGMTVVLAPPTLVIRTLNTSRNGLGEPLPRGTVRIFEQRDGRRVLAGQTGISDVPVGSPLDFEFARALDSSVDLFFDVTELDRDRIRLHAEIRTINSKTVPIDLEIRHRSELIETSIEIEESSRPFVRSGGYFTWRFTTPPGAETLSYTLLATETR